jgi:hypothetical protein
MQIFVNLFLLFHLQAEVLLTVCEALMEFVTVHGADRDVRTAEQLIGRNSMIERGFFLKLHSKAVEPRGMSFLEKHRLYICFPVKYVHSLACSK